MAMAGWTIAYCRRTGTRKEADCAVFFLPLSSSDASSRSGLRNILEIVHTPLDAIVLAKQDNPRP